MKKMYVLTLLSMCFAGMSMAQEVATAVTVNNWDGSPLENNTLYIGVDETKELNFTTEPENADRSTVRLGITMGNDGEIYVAFQDFNVAGRMEGEAWLYVYSTVLKEQTEGEEDRDRKIGGPVRVICSNYMASGEFWPEGADEPCMWMIDYEGRLSFDVYFISADNPTFNISDYRTKDAAPWYEYRELIKSIDFTQIGNVGNYAFCDMPNLKTVDLTCNVQYLGEYVFLGCTNLKSMRVQRYTEQDGTGEVEEPMITMTSGNSLIIDNSSPNFPVRVGAIVVMADGVEEAVWAYNSPDYEWSQCHVISEMAWGDEAEYGIEILESGEIALNVQWWGDGETSDIGDRQEGQSYYWDALGEAASALTIGGGFSYIGNGVFDQLSGLRKITIFQEDEETSLDRIHAGAFSESIMPWKFAFGEPMNGPIIPPTVVIPEGQTERNVIENWRRLFGDSTVLYVPDSTFEYEGEMVRSIDLYRNDPIWGQVFNCLTDRTVNTAPAGNNTDVLLEWMPLEGMTNYRLTVHKKDCDTCYQSIDIPALSERGTVDWSMIKIEAAQGRRAPMSNDGGGGLTLTIQPGSGMMHNSSMNVSVGGLEEEGEYEFTREAFLLGWTEPDPEYTDEGEFTIADATAIEAVRGDRLSVRGEKMVYDILGRKMGTSLETLPEGLYIYDNGTERTKIMLRR